MLVFFDYTPEGLSEQLIGVEALDGCTLVIQAKQIAFAHDAIVAQLVEVERRRKLHKCHRPDWSDVEVGHQCFVVLLKPANHLFESTGMMDRYDQELLGVIITSNQMNRLICGLT